MAAKGKKRKMEPEEEHENGERWLLTYSDMITLLLGLFIVLYSMSNVDVKKYEQFAQAANKVFGVSSGGNSVVTSGQGAGVVENNFPTTKADSSKVVDEKETGGTLENKTMESLYKSLKNYIDKNKLSKQIAVENQQVGVDIKIKDSYIFASGKADISKTARDKIDKIGIYLKSVSNYIDIQGHTDNVPINRNNTEFKSNRELSFARADNVLNVLTHDLKIDPAKMTPTAKAEYDPIATNATEWGRAQNRRVEIVILREKYALIQKMR